MRFDFITPSAELYGIPWHFKSPAMWTDQLPKLFKKFFHNFKDEIERIEIQCKNKEKVPQYIGNLLNIVAKVQIPSALEALFPKTILETTDWHWV